MIKLVCNAGFARKVQMAKTQHDPTIEEYHFSNDGQVPNNPSLPAVIYRAVLEIGPGAAATCEALFASNDWSAAWVDGIYAHHHYHSTAHEVLGITAGSVRVRLGGEHGKLLELGPGDVVIIPAGVAHKNEGASPDLIVVGAYPGGRSPDMRRPTAQEREKTLRNIAQVTLPVCDPVYGPSGPLLDRWRAADRT
jgi:uncharacterized protein YjlB